MDATKEDLEPKPHDFITSQLKEAFEKVRGQDVSPNIQFFIPAIKRICETLNAQDGLTVSLASYSFTTMREAPLKTDVSAFADATEYKSLGKIAIYGTKCLNIKLSLAHDLHTKIMREDPRFETQTPQLDIILFDHGNDRVRWDTYLSRYRDPEQSHDPFTEQSDNLLIKMAASAVVGALTASITKAKENEALMNASSTVPNHIGKASSKKRITLK